MTGIIASQAFSPNKIAGLQFWSDATDSARTIESGGFVSQWGDKSGTGNEAVQTTGTMQPQTGGSLNGVDAITWDSSNDALVVPATASLAGIFSTGATIMFVSRNVGSDFPRTMNLQGHVEIFLENNGSEININTQFSISNAIWFSPHGLNTTLISTITYDGSDVANVPNFYRDGVLETATLRFSGPSGVIQDGTGEMVVGNSAGLNRPFDGDLGEMAIWNRILTSTELDEAHTYFINKWGISLTFPFAFSSDFSSDFS